MFESGVSICCCCFVYLAIMITSIVLFSQAYEVVNPGRFAILQNKFTKKFDTEVYYSGRYYTGIAKRFIDYPMQYQTIIFSNRRSNADAQPIISTTSSSSSLSVGCLIQYIIRPERIQEIYVKWPNIDRLKSDLLLSIKQIVSGVINQYRPDDFRTIRDEINTRMSYNIGQMMKDQFFCDLNLFTISEVILESRDINGYLQAQLTNKSTLLLTQTSQVLQKQSEIETVRANNANEIANINAASLASASQASFALITSADQWYTTNTIASLSNIKTAYDTATGSTNATQFAAFMYFIKIITARTNGTLLFGFD